MKGILRFDFSVPGHINDSAFSGIGWRGGHCLKMATLAGRERLKPSRSRGPVCPKMKLRDEPRKKPVDGFAAFVSLDKRYTEKGC
jgi:hypothetical protein